MKMESLVHTSKKIKLLFLSCFSKVSSLFFLAKSCWSLLSSYFRDVLIRLNPFWVQLHYFIILSMGGYLALKVSKPRTPPAFSPKDLDLFFTSVSAATVSSMSTVEMEVFSNAQLVILSLLMLVGGEVFTSLLELQLTRFKFTTNDEQQNKVDFVVADSDSGNSLNQVELGLINLPQSQSEDGKPNSSSKLKCSSIKYLGYVVLWYLLVAHLSGYTLLSLYINFVPIARQVLKNKGLSVQTFSVFLTVSTISNCGFIPLNEGMMVFIKNPGLLLLLIPYVFLGNTLFAPCLRLVIWVLERVKKKEEFSYMLKNYEQLGYDHLFSRLRSMCLAATVFGFVLVQFVLFCSMEWNSKAMVGLSSYQKLVGSLFQVVNSRHAGESAVDLSLISPALLVLFIVMMYLPPYTSFFPTGAKGSTNEKKNSKKFVGYVLFSQLAYLVIFIILICITEREKMEEDPLNFNVLNITLEVVSAYGNVGFSTGYSCNRRLNRDNYCQEKWFGFVGKWSNKGKVILILVMFFGRLQKFCKGGGTAWKLS